MAIDGLSHFDLYSLLFYFASGQGTGVGGLSAAECMSSSLPMGTASSLDRDRVPSPSHEREHEKEHEFEPRDGGGADRVILTDLAEVVPLLEANVVRWRKDIDRRRDRGRDWRRGGVSVQGTDYGSGGGVSDGQVPDVGTEFKVPKVKVRALPWGDRAAANRVLVESSEDGGTGITHILCSDLVSPRRCSNVVPPYYGASAHPRTENRII